MNHARCVISFHDDQSFETLEHSGIRKITNVRNPQQTSLCLNPPTSHATHQTTTAQTFQLGQCRASVGQNPLSWPRHAHIHPQRPHWPGRPTLTGTWRAPSATYADKLSLPLRCPFREKPTRSDSQAFTPCARCWPKHLCGTRGRTGTHQPLLYTRAAGACSCRLFGKKPAATRKRDACSPGVASRTDLVPLEVRNATLAQRCSTATLIKDSARARVRRHLSADAPHVA